VLQRACLGVGAALALLLALPVRAGATPEAPVLRVTIYPRATLHDAIDVCPENSFPNSKQGKADALRLGRLAIEAMDLTGARAVYQPDVEPNCVFIHPRGPITVVGPRSHERTFSLDAGPLYRLAVSKGFSDLVVNICTPAVPTVVTATPPAREEDSNCDQLGYLWEGSFQATVSFRATFTSLFKGVIGGAAYWAIVVVIGRFVRQRLDRNDRWDWFRRRRALGWMMPMIPIAIVGGMWGFFFAYWSNLVPSLQLYFGAGVLGEVVVTVGPIVIFLLLTVRARHRGLGAIYRKYPDRAPSWKEWPDDALRPLRTGSMRRSLAWEVLFVVPFALIFLLAEGPLPDRASVYATVVLSVMLILFGSFVHDELNIWMSRSVRLNAAQEKSIIQRAASFRLNISELWISREPVHALKGVGRRASPLSPAAVGDRKAIVWERVADLKPEIVCGGLLNGLGLSQFRIVALFGPLFAATSQADAGETVVPWWIFGLLGGISVLTFAYDGVKRVRVMRAAASSPVAVDLMKGMLYFGRISARSIYPVRGLKLLRRMPFKDVQEQYMASLAKQVRRFADRAGISANTFDAAVAETEGMDEA
jgi:hypothetical protein